MTPLCRSVGWLVSWSVGPLFTIYFFWRFWGFRAYRSCPDVLVTFCSTDPAHPHATRVDVYPALFFGLSMNLIWQFVFFWGGGEGAAVWWKRRTVGHKRDFVSSSVCSLISPSNKLLTSLKSALSGLKPVLWGLKSNPQPVDQPSKACLLRSSFKPKICHLSPFNFHQSSQASYQPCQPLDSPYQAWNQL